MVAVENSLHNLGFTLDTDKMISPQPRTYDIPIQKGMDQQHSESIQKDLASKHLTFIGHLASDDGLSLMKLGHAQDKGNINTKGKTPAWYERLKESICEKKTCNLKAHLTVSPSNSDSRPIAPSIAEQSQQPNRTDQYVITSTPSIAVNAPSSAPRITVSDGSMRGDKAAFSTLPIQNCTTTCTQRVIGRQNVAKSEILGCYASAKDTPNGQSITNILDNLGVVTTINRGPPGFSRHRLRRNNRTAWNLLFGTLNHKCVSMDAI